MALPYYLRYSTGVHAVMLPSAEHMVRELQSLLNLVQTTIARPSAQ